MRALFAVAAIFAFFAAEHDGALGQDGASQQKPAPRIVTILSDTLAQPDSKAARMLGEVALSIDRDGDMRVLTVAGYGGTQNVSDLLQLRGADLAVLNNDIFAYLALARELPDAPRRIRLVTSLFTQAGFVFARRGIDTVEALAGRKVCVPAKTDQVLSATTIFALLNVKATIRELEADDFKTAASTCDAIFLYEQNLKALESGRITPAEFQLVSIPAADALNKIYTLKTLKTETLGAFASADITTVQVTTVLASYNWAPNKTRYLDAVAFVEKLFRKILADRAAKADTPLARVDIAKVPTGGWQRFPPAATLVASLDLPALAAAEPAKVPFFPAAREPQATATISIGAVVRPPLINGQQEKGGVLLDLFLRSMAGAGIEAKVTLAQSERELFESVLATRSLDVGLFWQTPYCEMHGGQSALEAFLCDRAEFSDPLMHMVLGIFTRIDAQLSKAGAAAEATSRVICIPESLSVPKEMLSSIAWLEGQTVRYLRPKVLIECLAALSRREADAMIAIEPETRFAIERLKLSGELHLSQKLSTPLALHAFVSKENPNLARLLADLNGALSEFRESQGYAAVLSAYLSELAGTEVLKASHQ